MWPVDDIFVLPGVIASLCFNTVSARMGVWHLLLSAQLPGTHWAMICMIRHLALTVSDVCLELGCFQSTSTYGTLDISHFMRYINPRLTCLLTMNCGTITNHMKERRDGFTRLFFSSAADASKSRLRHHSFEIHSDGICHEVPSWVNRLV